MEKPVYKFGFVSCNQFSWLREREKRDLIHLITEFDYKKQFLSSLSLSFLSSFVSITLATTTYHMRKRSSTTQQPSTEAQPPPPNYRKMIYPTMPTQIPTHRPKSQTHCPQTHCPQITNPSQPWLMVDPWLPSNNSHKSTGICHKSKSPTTNPK